MILMRDYDSGIDESNDENNESCKKYFLENIVKKPSSF